MTSISDILNKNTPERDLPVDELVQELYKTQERNVKMHLLMRIHNQDPAQYRVELGRWWTDDPDLFRDIKITPTPEPPLVMRQYYHLTDEQKRRMTKDFWEKPEVAEYIDRKARTIARNRHMYRLAHEILDWLPDGDYPRIEKVRERIKEMSGMLAQGGLPTDNKNIEDETIEWED